MLNTILTLAEKKYITIGEALNISITGIVVVMLVLALLAVLVLLLSKGIRAVEGVAKKKSGKKADSAASEAKAETPSKPIGTALPESASAGDLDLYNVDEKTAAVIMAIVSNESGIPLNRLLFKSIKAIEK